MHYNNLIVFLYILGLHTVAYLNKAQNMEKLKQDVLPFATEFDPCAEFGLQS